jgi:hypothetical protein
MPFEWLAAASTIPNTHMCIWRSGCWWRRVKGPLWQRQKGPRRQRSMAVSGAQKPAKISWHANWLRKPSWPRRCSPACTTLATRRHGRLCRPITLRARSQQLLRRRRHRCGLHHLSGASTSVMKCSLFDCPSVLASACPYRLLDERGKEIAWANALIRRSAHPPTLTALSPRLCL